MYSSHLALEDLYAFNLLAAKCLLSRDVHAYTAKCRSSLLIVEPVFDFVYELFHC